MIKNRPAFLVNDKAYQTLPKEPFEIDWRSIPDLIQVTILGLGGIQPLTHSMAAAAGGSVYDQPSDGEIALFRERGTKFQMISVVLSCVAAGKDNNRQTIRPFAVTLIPASKRGGVEECSVDWIANINTDKMRKAGLIYIGYNPFSGKWSLYGNIPGYLDGQREGYFDEVGIVIDQFFLATQTPQDEEILTMDIRMPTAQMQHRYEKHRQKLFFTPFEKVEARRVWGAETPIELFLLQALAPEGLFPECQVLIMDDGATFPSLYHLWHDIEFRHSDGLVTEVDLYFPENRVAVFCDGGHHSRAKVRIRDAEIDTKLKSLGIHPVRITGDEIRHNLPAAIEEIKTALSA